MQKLLLILIALLISATSLALPVAWSKYKDGTRGGKMIRDASSNVYFVTSQPTGTGRRYTIEKFNAAGVRLWENSVAENGTLGLQFDIKQLAITPTGLYVLVQVREGGGTGTANQSWIRRHSLDTGGWVGGFGSFYEAWESIDLNDAEIAIHGRDTLTGNAMVYIASLDLSSWDEFDLGSCEAAGEVKMDPSGFTYVVTTHFNKLKLSKCLRSSGVIYQVDLDSANHFSEDGLRLEIDYLTNRAYVLMRGAFGPSDIDIMLYYVNLATGAQLSIQPVSSTVNSEWEAQLTLLPNAGVIASAVVTSLDQTRIVRRDPTGALVWSTTVAVPFSNEPHCHALGPDGSFHIASYFHNSPSLIHRLHSGTGASLGQFTTGFFSGRPRQFVLDAAGNIYANYDLVNGAIVARLQPAQLSFSANNLPGGAAAHGVITLSEPATANQVWTVASSNASLVGVPSTATVTAGNSSVNFPLTIGSVAAITSVSVNVRYGGFISQQVLTLVPSLAQSVTIIPQVVIGGIGTTGTVTLNGVAPAGGRLVNLSSNKTSVATVPASVTVAAGNTTANFPITTFGVNANQGVVITATTGSLSRTAFFAVNAPALTTISVNPATLKGGVTGSLTLNISGAAPLGGFSIVLFSGAPGIVFLPAAASVTAGLTSRTISVPTAAVTATTAVTIFATRSGIYRTTTLTVTP